MNLQEFLKNMFEVDPKLLRDLSSRVKTVNSVMFPSEEVLQGEASDPSRILRALLGGKGLMRLRALPSKADPLVQEGLINPVSYKAPTGIDLSQQTIGTTTLRDLIDKGVFPHSQPGQHQDILDSLFSVLKSQRKPLK